MKLAGILSLVLFRVHFKQAHSRYVNKARFSRIGKLVVGTLHLIMVILAHVITVIIIIVLIPDVGYGQS